MSFVERLSHQEAFINSSNKKQPKRKGKLERRASKAYPYAKQPSHELGQRKAFPLAKQYTTECSDPFMKYYLI